MNDTEQPAEQQSATEAHLDLMKARIEYLQQERKSKDALLKSKDDQILALQQEIAAKKREREEFLKNRIAWDGNAYTQVEFKDYYGDAWHGIWNAARLEPATLKAEQEREQLVIRALADCQEAAFAVVESWAGGFSAADSKQAGFSAAVWKIAGFSGPDCRQAGFSAEDLQKAGFSAADCREAGFSVSQCRQAGFSALEQINVVSEQWIKNSIT